LFRVVVSVAVGAPVVAFPLLVAPIAPEPLVPDVSVPAKLITVIEDAVLSESVAVTATLLSRTGANARQISEVPACTFVLTTSDQIKLAPATLLTLALEPVRWSVEIKASSNSLPAVVENFGEITLKLFVELSRDTLASMVSDAV
jgi:hypothetical protein